MLAPEVVGQQAAAHDRHQAIGKAEQQREDEQRRGAVGEREDRQRHRESAEHNEAERARRDRAAECEVQQSPEHLRRPEPHDDGERLRFAAALGSEGRHQMRPHRRGCEPVEGEARGEQPERPLAQRLVQGAVGARIGGTRRRSVLRRERIAPAAPRHQPGRGGERQGTRESSDQRQRRDAAHIAVGKALRQHVERRLVQGHRHRHAEQRPGEIEHRQVVDTRPEAEADTRERRAERHHLAAAAPVDGRADGVAGSAPHREADGECAHQLRLAPAERALHRQHEGRECVVQRGPANDLSHRERADGAAIRGRRGHQRDYRDRTLSRLGQGLKARSC